jgi:hypothetical protein
MFGAGDNLRMADDGRFTTPHVGCRLPATPRASGSFGSWTPEPSP